MLLYTETIHPISVRVPNVLFMYEVKCNIKANFMNKRHCNKIKWGIIHVRDSLLILILNKGRLSAGGEDRSWARARMLHKFEFHGKRRLEDRSRKSDIRNL